MQIYVSFPFTYCFPDLPNDRAKQLESGELYPHIGRWVIFNRRSEVDKWVGDLAQYIDSGEIRQAKFYSAFRGDPSALIVYTFDSDKNEAWQLLERIGVNGHHIWEYQTEMNAFDRKLCTIVRSMLP